ncbi:hypothetical protein KSF_066370 [Reticulibacter mediterranei]|uniref:WD40 repeat domain-containing protein n=1 Tax=Reticulibacter mediterranei TaxID=2778369 RepID=A0A8J3IRH9_9CHLR|nr:RNaseH domain-containing protein [Reticulibacter mediterranei]GHO96589.1 hypothetical protein KSF_066370 [Reticulibacter mediterranei]
MSYLPNHMLLARFYLRPQALQGRVASFLDFVWSEPLNAFIEQYALRSLMERLQIYLPHNRLNRAILAQSLPIAHPFELFRIPGQDISTDYYRCMLSLETEERLLPTPQDIQRIVAIWLQHWFQSAFSSKDLGSVARQVELLNRLNDVAYSVAPTWYQRELYDFWTLQEDTRRYHAIPSVLASLLHNQVSVIDGIEVRWRLALDQKHHLVVVSDPLICEYPIRDEDGQIHWKGGTFAYKLSFALHTFAGAQEQCVHIFLSCTRYLDQPVTRLKRGHEITIQMRTSKARKEGWPVAQTLVPLSAITYAGLEKVRWHDSLAELLERLEVRMLADPKDILASPLVYRTPNMTTRWDQFLPVQAEWIKPSHGVKTGFSCQERLETIQSLLPYLEEFLQPCSPLQRDSKTTMPRKIWSLLPWNELHTHASQEICAATVQQAIMRALGGKLLTLLVCWYTRRTRDAVYKQLRKLLFLTEASPWPENIRVIDYGISEKLVGSLDSGNLDPQDFYNTARPKDFFVQWNKQLGHARAERLHTWEQEVWSQLTIEPDSHKLVLIELPRSGKDIHPSQGPKGILRHLVVVDWHAGNQMLHPMLPRYDEDHQPLPENSRRSQARVKNAIADLLFRQTGVVFEPPTAIYTQQAKLPAAIADDLTVIGLYYKKARRTYEHPRIELPLAVRLQPSGVAEICLPKEEGRKGAWFPYRDAATTELGPRFAAKKGLMYSSSESLLFLQEILQEQRSHPTLVIVCASDWRSNIWPQLRNDQLQNPHCLDINNPKLNELPVLLPITPNTDPFLRVIRLRERGSGGETPQYITTREQISWDQAQMAKESRSAFGCVDTSVTGPFLHYLSLADKTVFGDVSDLLERQFQRLSEQEQEIIYWLAIEQQPVVFQHLWECLVHPVSKSLLLEVLASLRRRSLIETDRRGQYFLQSVISEYVLEKLTKQIYHELDRGQFNFFSKVALMQAQVRENIRIIQIRLIVMPLLAMLRGHLGEQGGINKLRHALTLLHTHNPQEYDYAASNLLHLLIHMRINLRGLNCSSLYIQHAYLRGVELPEVDFSSASFKASTFTDTFGSIFCVAFNANGSLFAAGMTNGEIRLWRASSLEPVQTLSGHIDGIRAIAFSPNGRLLASCSHDQTIRIWNVLTARCQKVLSEHNGPVRSLAFHPSGQLLASGSEDGSILVFNMDTGECIRNLGGYGRWILTIAFSPDGSLLVSGDEEGCIKIWEVASSHCVETLSAHTFRIRSLAFAPGGDIFASSSDDRTIKVWDARTRQLLYVLEEPVAHCTRSIAFSPDGKKLAAGGDDQVIYLWDLASRKCQSVLQGHTNRIWSVAFHPEKPLLLSGSEDQTVRLWDWNTGHCHSTLQGYRSMFWSVAFSPDTRLLSSGGEDSVCRIWEFATGRCLKMLFGHTNQIRCTAFSPDGTILASGSDDLTIRLWDIATAQPLNVLRGHKHLVHSLAFHPDGKILVSGSHDKSIQLWDVNTGNPLASLPDHYGLVWSVAFSPDGRLIASGSEDKHLRIWDVETRSCQALLQGHRHRIWTVAFSPDGQLVASGSDDKTIRIWRVSDGLCLVSLQGHTHWVRALACSPDGKTLASGSHDKTIRLWNINTGQCLATLKGHESRIWSVAFSSDGEMLASGSDDGTIKFWNRYTGECLQTLRCARPYEGMNITGVEGLSEMQRKALKALGAIVR